MSIPFNLMMMSQSEIQPSKRMINRSSLNHPICFDLPKTVQNLSMLAKLIPTFTLLKYSPSHNKARKLLYGWKKRAGNLYSSFAINSNSTGGFIAFSASLTKIKATLFQLDPSPKDMRRSPSLAPLTLSSKPGALFFFFSLQSWPSTFQ